MKLKHKLTIRCRATSIVKAAVVGKPAVRRLHNYVKTFILQYSKLTPQQQQLIEEVADILANNAATGTQLNKYDLKKVKRVVNLLNKAVEDQKFKLNVVPIDKNYARGQDMQANVVMAHGDSVDYGPKLRIGVVYFPYEYGKSPKALLKKNNEDVQKQVQKLLKQKKSKIDKFLKNNPPTAAVLKDTIIDILKQLAH